jgi:hypothetical protein
MGILIIYKSNIYQESISIGHIKTEKFGAGRQYLSTIVIINNNHEDFKGDVEFSWYAYIDLQNPYAIMEQPAPVDTHDENDKTIDGDGSIRLKGAFIPDINEGEPKILRITVISTTGEKWSELFPIFEIPTMS